VRAKEKVGMGIVARKEESALFCEVIFIHFLPPFQVFDVVRDKALDSFIIIPRFALFVNEQNT
jgi:hypothetical protein